ncbi:RNA-binding protein [Bacteriovorax sp. Seq25_V]|uniref:RNA recognition motif domain-containing protein n=1 Tax=Bacteriovorax sp. Seq25_V TaxID=1201288 RepID=UPI00038A081D|nr:RNA-binding protein [Bacteriovorax sp. Seq25_V]EQC44274.1 hypothetical protein M900_A0406 [Bacteriovorax sp. Seq25_V]
MGSQLYVGNISFNTKEEDLKNFFSAAGTVNSAKIIMDRETGRSRGFGFVEMSSAEEAEQAVATLNGKELGGRDLRVNIAEEKKDRGPRRRF